MCEFQSVYPFRAGVLDMLSPDVTHSTYTSHIAKFPSRAHDLSKS